MISNYIQLELWQSWAGKHNNIIKYEYKMNSKKNIMYAARLFKKVMEVLKVKKINSLYGVCGTHQNIRRIRKWHTSTF